MTLLWFFCMILLVIVVLCIPFYIAVLAGKQSMSSRQAASYWRTKFRDETALHEQQETLLRSSQERRMPETLLRPAQEGERQMPAEQFVRASQEPAQAQEAVLLPAATHTQDGHEEQLLRASAGEQE